MKRMILVMVIAVVMCGVMLASEVNRYVCDRCSFHMDKYKMAIFEISGLVQFPAKHLCGKCTKDFHKWIKGSQQ